jgi:hypothetical protein
VSSADHHGTDYKFAEGGKVPTQTR